MGIKDSQRGAVSIFVVVFSALLITTITVAFVRLMAQNQNQAMLNDLSKSALDSAYAGVEDAKRALITYRKYCMPGGSGTVDECDPLTRALTTGSPRCNTLQEAGIAGEPTDKEVRILQNEGDEKLDQAYTCVRIQLNTADYVASLTKNSSRLIPLRSDEPYSEVKIRWYTQADLRATQEDDDDDSGGVIDVNLAPDSKLPKQGAWPENRPALLRVQLVQFGDDFNLSEFDDIYVDGDDNTHTNNATLFLVPASAGLGTVSFASDARQSSSTDTLLPVACDQDFSTVDAGDPENEGYACNVTVQLPNPVGETNGDSRRAYLRVTQIYNPITTVNVSLWNGLDNPYFSAVQPIVDSTGRANDLFRRISARIEMETSYIPPLESAIDLTGSLCKTIMVTDDPREYSPGSCGY